MDEVGYGPRLGPMVLAAVCAEGPLRTRLRIADSKKVFSQARGVRTLEPTVLAFLPAATFDELLGKLSCRLPDAPWYRGCSLPLPASRRSAPPLAGAYARFVEPSEFNAGVAASNKSEFLFRIAAGLINQIRAAHPGPVRFHVGKHGGRHYYLRGVQQFISPTVMVREETPTRSTYEIPGATITFVEGAEDRHRLVALASMIGKYVRECAMKLFNDFWSARLEGLRRTAGYGRDGLRFYAQIAAELERLALGREAVLRLR